MQTGMSQHVKPNKKWTRHNSNGLANDVLTVSLVNIDNAPLTNVLIKNKTRNF